METNHALLGLIAVLVIAPSGAVGNFIAPGTAGVHASVQAFPGGPQENFGGYGALARAGEQQESWALPQQQQQSNMGAGVQWCAGCLPGMESRSDSSVSWGNERRRDFQHVQPLQQLQPDGQYSFSYSGGDSSRQEQRNLDGTVVGSYAFTDPDGQAVQVQYRAAPNQGFSAFPTYGREMVPSSVGAAGGQFPSPYASAGQGPSQLNVLPSPPQETPEVLAARAQFFRAYDQQLQLVKASQEAAARAQASASGNSNNQVVSVYSENAQPSQQQQQGQANNNPGQQDEAGQSSKNPLNFKNLPEPIAVPDGNQVAGESVDDDDEIETKDAIVISADDEDAGSIPRPSSLTNAKRPGVPQLSPLRQPAQTIQGQQQQQQQFNQPQQLVQPSFSFSTVLGSQPQYVPQGIPTPNQQQLQQPTSTVLGLQNFPALPPVPFQQQQSQSQSQQSQLKGGLEPYFYYVSVGGQPHYVTSNNFMRSDYPTSLKAQQTGAAPIDAQHNSQIPFNAKDGQTLTRSSPPLYLDFDLSKTIQQSKESRVPGIIYGFVPSGLNVNNQQFAPPQSESLTQTNVVQQGQQGQQNLPFVGYPVFYVNKK